MAPTTSLAAAAPSSVDGGFGRAEPLRCERRRAELVRLRIGGGPFQAECEHLRAEQRRRRRVALAARALATRGRSAVPLSLRLLRHARREGAELRALAVAEQTVTSLPRSNQPGAAPSALPSGLHLATSRRARHRASAASRRAACAGARSPRQAPKGRVARACRRRVVDTARPSPSASAFWPDSRIGAYREGSETLPRRARTALPRLPHRAPAAAPSAREGTGRASRTAPCRSTAPAPRPAWPVHTAGREEEAVHAARVFGVESSLGEPLGAREPGGRLDAILGVERRLCQHGARLGHAQRRRPAHSVDMGLASSSSSSAPPSSAARYSSIASGSAAASTPASSGRELVLGVASNQERVGWRSDSSSSSTC